MSYEYAFTRGAGPTLVHFHGTGGDEHQLADLAQAVAPTWPKLAPRGQHLEGNALRFFRRFAEGQLDEEDLARRAEELAAWVPAVLAERELEPPVVAMGYSNGASISAGILLLHPEVFDAAVLLRPMVPLVPDVLPDLGGKRVLILASSSDPITPIAGGERLAVMLERAGAAVMFESVPGGHSLTAIDVGHIRSFLGTN